MTEIVTWNIQACRGVDGTVDARRIARVLRDWTDADVICLQEVSRYASVADEDQVALLGALFPGYSVHFGPAFDRLDRAAGKRRMFGNLILSRLPVLQAFSHPLPHPAIEGIHSMPRQATEAVVETAAGPLRILTTHLEYTSAAFRTAQLARLRDLHIEAAQRAALSDLPGKGDYTPWPRPAEAVICGDFNMLPGSEEYAGVLAPFPEGVPALHDAWELAHPGAPHGATVGVHDHEQWPQGPHCRDYLFVSTPLADRVRGLEVEGITDASDHQPVRLVIG